MTLADKQQSWIEDWGIIPDSYERLSALMAEAGSEPAFGDDLKREEWLVPGCQARVWLLGGVGEDGLCRFRADSDAPMVRALAVFLCRLYSGHPAAEVIEVEPEILDRLGLSGHLTPTRRRGLEFIRLRLRQLAGGGATGEGPAVA